MRRGGRRGGQRRVQGRAWTPGAARWPALAAAAFGAWYVLIDLAARAGDPLWALVFSRATSASIADRDGVRRALDRTTFPVAIVIAAGLLDVGR